MLKHEALPSKWLSAADLLNDDGESYREVAATIDRLTMEQMGNGERKPALWFKGKQKALIVNATNWDMLEQLCKSPNSDDWTGMVIRLYVDENVMNRGQRTTGIRIKSAPKTTAKNGPQHIVNERPGYSTSTMQPPKDDVPFDDDLGDFR